jgi:hypothetical protein
VSGHRCFSYSDRWLDIRTIEKIPHLFHIDFHIRHLDSEFDSIGRKHDALEDLFDDTGNDTFVFGVINVGALEWNG